MIKTNEIKLTKREYFKILARKYFKEKWWLVGAVLILAIIAVSKDYKDAFDYFIIVFGIGYPIYLLIFFRNFAYSKENKIVLLGRHYEFHDEQLIAQTEDGTRSEILYKNFTKILNMKEFAMLYLSKASFIYLPKNAFESEDDFNKVIKNIELSISK